MRNALLFLVVCVGVQFCAGCGDDKSSNPPDSVPTYSLSGTVRTLFASTGSYRAHKVTMVFVDSQLDSQTVVTDSVGFYAVDGLAPGSVAVSMFSRDTMITDYVNSRSLLLYSPQYTTVSLNRDTVIDWTVRRIEFAFSDGGYSPEKWAWEYGVTNKYGMYMFWYDLRGSDMRMRDNVQLPPGALRLGFIIQGEARSRTSYMDVDWYMNDVPGTNPQLSGMFIAGHDLNWIEELPSNYPWPPEDTVDFRLSLDYRGQLGDSVYIKGIFIYYY